MLGSVTLVDDVESDGSSDVDVCCCSVALGCPVILWVPLELAGLPVSENTPLNESVTSLPVIPVDGALWV